MALGRALILSDAGRVEQAAAGIQTWVAQHGGDAEAWDRLGRARVRMGRPAGAAAAFARAQALGYQAGVSERLRAARWQAAPALEPYGGTERDSDGNRTYRAGASADLALSDGVRVGFGAGLLNIKAGATSRSGLQGVAGLSGRPHSTLRIQLAAGATRFDPAPSSTGWTSLTGEARLRWRAPDGGPALEVRGQRLPLGTTPELVANQVARTEGRTMVEIPAGPVRLRAGGRYGAITSLSGTNTRRGVEGAVVRPLGWQGEVSAQYRRLAYANATDVGYFAPRLAETVDAGAYYEFGDAGPVLVAVDLGAGVQRTAKQGERPGPWKPSFRLWGWIAVPVGSSTQLRLEGEAYDAPFAPEGVTTNPSWRFGSLSLTVRQALP